ncbi:MAG: acetoin utilization protein acuB [Flavobacteriaceae bacterium]|nr:acetoin utilization protein acuB [Bacteroidia bacterium]NNL17018.1 acetoin utilization protein acuB [Flavobacteriaceae bacterium]
MNLSQYVINDIKPINSKSLCKELQLLFNQLTYSHVPVEYDGIYVGCLSETDTYCFDSDKVIDEYKYALEGFFVRQKTNWLDVLDSFAENSSNIMPVLNDKNEYLGYYELNDIINLFGETPFFSEAGGVLIVEKGIHDYSFSEVCQIVESNDGKVLGCFISKMKNDVTQITLKIANVPLNDIMQSFRRYSYNIVSDHENDTFIENLKERSDYLNKYLNI